MAILNSDTYESDGDWDGTEGSAYQIVSSGAHGGTKALRVYPAVAKASLQYTIAETAGVYVQFWLKVTTAPASDAFIIELWDNTATRCGALALNTDRTLQAWTDVNDGAQGSKSSALTLDTWYKVKWHFAKEPTGADDGAWEFWLNDVSQSSDSTANTGANDLEYLWVGNKSYNANMDIVFDDMSIADSNVATTYTLTGPDGNLTRNTESGNFTVTPDGDADGNIVVTPSDEGAGGVLNPTTVTFLDGQSTAKTFKYTPRAAGGNSVTISCTDNGGLTDPAGVTKTVDVALTQYRITGSPTLFVSGSANYVIDFGDDVTGNIS